MDSFLTSPETIRSRVRTALELEPADLLFKNCNVINVLSEEIYSADIAIRGNRIVAVRKEYQGISHQVIECDGLFAVPGFINPNFDVPEIQVPPAELGRILIPNGITTLLTIREIPASRDDNGEIQWKMDLSENYLRHVMVERAAFSMGESVPMDLSQIIEQIRTGRISFLNSIQDIDSFFKKFLRKDVDTNSLCFRSDCFTPSLSVSQENNHFWSRIQSALKMGISPAKVFQMASFNAAAFFGLDHLLGSISPSRLADIVLLKALDQFPPSLVVVNGKIVARDGLPLWGID